VQQQSRRDQEALLVPLPSVLVVAHLQALEPEPEAEQCPALVRQQVVLEGPVQVPLAGEEEAQQIAQAAAAVLMAVLLEETLPGQELLLPGVAQEHRLRQGPLCRLEHWGGCTHTKKTC